MSCYHCGNQAQYERNLKAFEEVKPHIVGLDVWRFEMLRSAAKPFPTWDFSSESSDSIREKLESLYCHLIYKCAEVVRKTENEMIWMIATPFVIEIFQCGHWSTPVVEEPTSCRPVVFYQTINQRWNLFKVDIQNLPNDLIQIPQRREILIGAGFPNEQNIYKCNIVGVPE